MNTFNLPKKVYFKRGCTPVALRELSEIYHCKKALLISDTNLFLSGTVSGISKQLQKQGIRTANFFSLNGVPAFADISNALSQAQAFQPDVIIGIGGGNPLGAAKALFLMANNPEYDFNNSDGIMQNVRADTGTKLMLIATTFSSGAQTSPLAILRNDKEKLCLLHSDFLIPEISVTDSDFTKSLTAQQVKAGGLTVLALSLRTYKAENSSAYMQSVLEEAIRIVLKHLPAAIAGCPIAREHLHNAGALAGTAYGNISHISHFQSPLYPSAEEKKTTNPRLETLAHNLGLDSTQSLILAWEKLT